MKARLMALSTLMAFTLYAPTTLANTQSTQNGTRSINGVKWHKTKTVSAENLANQNIPYGATSVFFIRPLDGDDIQTSANVAINDRFQTSLQPGNFSQVYSCSGINEISADITGRKHNDLSINKLTFNLTPNDSYFFYVDVTGQGHASVKHISKNDALRLMQNMPHQTHQISRVVPNCQVPPPPPVIPVMPPPPTPPVIERHTIDLEVLFDTDKHFVKEQYMTRIIEVAQFMRQYPNAVANIEGHTDSRASDSYNQALSQRRVDAVRKILIERFGIAPDRLNAVGYGESRPIASNDTPEGRQLNRRVVAVFDNY